MPPNMSPTFSLYLMSMIIILIHVPTSLCDDNQQYVACGRSFQCQGITANYPFWGGNRPEYCGRPEFQLNCQDNNPPILTIQTRTYRVLSIDNRTQTLTVAREEFWNSTCPTFLYNATLDTNLFNYGSNTQNLRLFYACPALPFQGQAPIPYQFSCTLNATSVNYYATSSDSVPVPGVTNLWTCNTCVLVPVFQTAYQGLMVNPPSTTVSAALTGGFELQWTAEDNNNNCNQCVQSGGRCGYNSGSRSFTCYCSDQAYSLECNSTQNGNGRDGNLVVLSGIGEEVIWSSNVRVDDSSVNSTFGELLETGNLVLRIRSGTNEEIELWQSFDHPTDTLLPGMKLGMNQKSGEQVFLTSWANDEDPKPGMFSFGLDPQGRAQFYIWKQQHHPYWRSNVFDGYQPLLIYNSSIRSEPYVSFSVVGDGKELLFSVMDESINYRATITPKGRGQVLSWPTNGNNTWQVIVDMPETECDVYGTCGPFSSCEQTSSPASCSCLPGFNPYSQIDWDKGNRSGGCVRNQFMSCNVEDRFQKMGSVKLPDFSLWWGNMSAKECELACLRNCSCTSYAYSVGDTTLNCLNWPGNLVDLLYNDFQGRDFYVRIPGSKKVARIKKSSTVIAATTVSIGLLLISVSICVLWRKKLRMKGRLEGNMQGMNSNSITEGVEQRDTELVSYNLPSILASTDNFSEANKLGEGGFGPVYKGSVPGFPIVAMKRLSKKSLQGTEEFMNELKLIAKLQHKNLVRILGYCFERDEKILIYEYMPNRSLDKFIFNPSEQTNLDWSNRFRIIEGITQGLLYLHKYSRLKVIHRDLKASNVLLDEAMNPKISDFGMARIVNINQTEANTNRVVGTYGYMSPEYALYGKFSEKSDVFSFGVLMLEIVSGRRNTNFYNTTFLTLLGWAWENWEVGKGEELIDPSIRESCIIQEALKCINVGLLCVQEVPSDRPSMSTVAFMLSNEIVSLPSPKQPAFSTRRRPSNTIGSSSQTRNKFSNNEVTISEPEAR